MARQVHRRAQLLRVTFPQGLKGKTLQEYLAIALKAPLSLDKTEFASAKFGALRINSAPKNSTAGGLCLKIVGHAAEEKATTVPVKLATAKKEESSAKPPKLQSYKNCDFFLIVRGNFLMGLGDHMRIETAVKYLRQLLQVKLNDSRFAAIDASAIFTYDTAKRLKNEGVRAIEFDASLSSAAVEKLHDEKYRGPIKNMLSGLSNTMSAVLSKDIDAAALADVNVSVTVSVRGGIKGSDLAQKAVERAANDLLTDTTEDVKDPISARIVTKDGNRISLSSATIGKDYKLHRRLNENSVRDIDAWEALEDFDSQVRGLGSLKT